jgi:hypothetical protein
LLLARATSVVLEARYRLRKPKTFRQDAKTSCPELA